MYARVSTYQGTAEDYDQGAERIKSDLVPRLQAIAGCKGILSMVDRSTGRSLSIALYDDEGALTSSREQADRLRSEAADSTGSKVNDITEYEVGVIEMF